MVDRRQQAWGEQVICLPAHLINQSKHLHSMQHTAELLYLSPFEDQLSGKQTCHVTVSYQFNYSEVHMMQNSRHCD